MSLANQNAAQYSESESLIYQRTGQKHHIENPIKKCSIISFDRSEGEFNTHQLQVETRGCFESSCALKIDSNLLQNEVILDGTSIVCDQQPYFGIITKSKLH